MSNGPGPILDALEAQTRTIFAVPVAANEITITSKPVDPGDNPIYPLWRFMPKKDFLSFQGLIRANNGKPSIYQLIAEYLPGSRADLTLQQMWDLLVADVFTWTAAFGSKAARTLGTVASSSMQFMEFDWHSQLYKSDLGRGVIGVTVLFTVAEKPWATGP